MNVFRFNNSFQLENLWQRPINYRTIPDIYYIVSSQIILWWYSIEQFEKMSLIVVGEFEDVWPDVLFLKIQEDILFIYFMSI